MIPTPGEVLPLLTPATECLRDALRRGVAYADEQQPDRVDPWFWSHSARFKARQELLLANPQPGVEGYEVRSDIPNSGIQLRFQRLHLARVLRSFGGTTPAPGRNPSRRRAWEGLPEQGQLSLAGDGKLPPLSLIIDWQDVAGEPLIHVGLPRAGWAHGKSPKLYWRVPMPDEGVDLGSLEFDGSDDGFGGIRLEIEIDEAEGANGR